MVTIRTENCANFQALMSFCARHLDLDRLSYQDYLLNVFSRLIYLFVYFCHTGLLNALSTVSDAELCNYITNGYKA